jgi:hypothetical protein
MALTESTEWMMGRVIAGCAFAVVVSLAAGCGKMPAQTSTANAPAAPTTAAAAAPASESKPASDAPLAWMEGSWCASDGDQRTEETWMLPQAGEAIGMSRTVEGGRQISYEFMRIAKLNGKDTLLAQPNGEPPTPFERTAGGADWIRFENKKHDYPQRIEYRKTGDGLHAEIGGPGAGDKEEVIPYEYTRCGK